MKSLILLIALLLSYQLIADDRLLPPDLQNRVIEEIENQCSDNWCEGDYDYYFQSIDCSKEQTDCTLHFQLQYIIWDDNYENPVFQSTYNATCLISPIYALEDILFMPEMYKDMSKMSQIILNEDFSTQLSDCIREKEQEAGELINQKINNVAFY